MMSGDSAPTTGGRPRTYKTEAVVLRSANVREADRLVTLLTPGHGKVVAAVRGARRPASRLGGHLDTLNHVALSLAVGHRFDVVTGAEALETFGTLKADLDRLAAALYVLELADALVPEATPHQEAYGLVLGVVRALDAGEDVGVAMRYAEVRLLQDGGFLPELRRCVVCGKEVKAGHHRFAPGQGGVVCDMCVVAQGVVLPLSVDTLKVLRFMVTTPLERASRLRVTPEQADQIEGVLASAVHYVVDREMASAAFVEQVRRLRRRRARLRDGQPGTGEGAQ